MIKNLQIFYSNKSKKYYCIQNDSLICNFCNKKIHNVLLYGVLYNKNKTEYIFSCLNCSHKIKKKAIIDEWKLIGILNKMPELPEDCIPILIKPPALIDGKISLFNLADIRNDCVIIDNTKYSFNPLKNIDTNVLKNKQLVEDRIAFLDDTTNNSLNNVDKIFNELQNAVPYQEKKLLNKEED